MEAVVDYLSCEDRSVYGSGDFLTCGTCAIWIELKEDSISSDMGICPRKRYPDCRTHRSYGCRSGVLSSE